jgi:hypothetical protein
MIRPTHALVFLLVCVGSAVGLPAASLDLPATGEPAEFQRVRTADPGLRRLLVDGIRDSKTLRALVDRIEASDVVVYLRCQGRRVPGVAGRLRFLASTPDIRYVVIDMTWLGSRVQQVALLAHELQHAVEIADTPAIVDDQSLAREYRRIGYVNRAVTGLGLTFDTAAAVEVGRLVVEEIAKSGELSIEARIVHGP